MAIATYQDLCIDAVDAHAMGRFWAAVLGLELQLKEPTGHGPGAKLVGPTPQHTVWISSVAEPVEVKQRVHLDVRADSLDGDEAMTPAR